MSIDGFPYQINAFLAQEPEPGEGIYTGENGWYPHLNLKRKFCLDGATEDQLFEDLGSFAQETHPFEVELGRVMEPSETPLPIRTIEVVPGPELMAFHLGVLKLLHDYTKSKFPEREGDNWLPHITLQDFDKQQVVDPDTYTRTTQKIGRFWVVRDPADSLNAQALAKFDLKK